MPPVIDNYVSSVAKPISDDISEKWKISDLKQSQYMVQIAKCADPSCSRPTLFEHFD